MSDLIKEVAAKIRDSFDTFHVEFKEMTAKATNRFAQRKWHEVHPASIERLDHYKKYVASSVEETKRLLAENKDDKATWVALKQEFSYLVEKRYDGPIVETFFNSVLRKIFITEGINDEVEFIDFEREVIFVNPDEPIYNSYFIGTDSIEVLVRHMIEDYDFQFGFADLDSDIRYISKKIQNVLMEQFYKVVFDRLDMLKSVFYRNKGAYLVGRIVKGNKMIPVVIPLVHPKEGVQVDNVLLTNSAISIVFSFTRSYFFVEGENPIELIHFLRPLMQHKAVSELYAAIGYNRHSKTVLYKEIYQQLDKHNEQFEFAPGIKGMVMSVFTLPSYNVVFKVIKDNFKPPKTVTREHVIKSYRLVFMHDRVGRLADAQEFEYLKFDKKRFKPEVLEELLDKCSGDVYIDGALVVIKQLFTERRMVPLNIYLEKADKEAARKVVIEYGNAIRELAAANIFPGDLLMKNFGVTRHGRVVFYDYDELCFLSDCNFRFKPVPRNDEQEYSNETWYTVGENDIFPEEFKSFMVPKGELMDLFTAHHADLFNATWWRKMQEMHTNKELADFYPYPRRRRESEAETSIIE